MVPNALPLWLTLIAVLLAGCSGASHVPSRNLASRCQDETAVDVLHHDVELDLSLTPPSLSGRGVLRLRTRKPTRQIILDAKMMVTDVRTDAARLHFTKDGGRLCADLPQQLPAGTELHLKLTWNVPPNAEMPAFAQTDVWAGYQTSAWMPTIQDSAQRATLALRIRAPSDLQVTASGRERMAVPASDRRVVHSFLIDRPAPPFLYAFAAGRFAESKREVDGLELRALGPPDANLTGALAATAHAYRVLSSQLGSRLPISRYTQVFVHGDAAQEAVGLALLSAAFLDDIREDPQEDWVFAHELAHQWFAWLVPCADFSDFWLNEGFATFLVAAIKEQRWGQPAYDREVKLWRTRSAKVHAQGLDMPVSMSTPGTDRRSRLADSALPDRGVTYTRGALVLHRLRSELGDAAFWSGLRTYVKKRSGQGARSEDLRKDMEVASGQDLQTFFAHWVYAPAPDL